MNVKCDYCRSGISGVIMIQRYGEDLLRSCVRWLVFETTSCWICQSLHGSCRIIFELYSRVSFWDHLCYFVWRRTILVCYCCGIVSFSFTLNVTFKTKKKTHIIMLFSTVLTVNTIICWKSVSKVLQASSCFLTKTDLFLFPRRQQKQTKDKVQTLCFHSWSQKKLCPLLT